MKVKSDIDHALDQGDGMLLFLLDLSAAFDTIGHQRIISRRYEIGIRGTALTYGRHSVLVDRFKVSVTNIIIDLFLETLYRWWLISVPFYSQSFYRCWRLVTLRPLTASTIYLPNMTIILIGFDFIIACGRCHWWGRGRLLVRNTVGSAFLTMRVDVWKVHMLCIIYRFCHVYGLLFWTMVEDLFVLIFFYISWWPYTVNNYRKRCIRCCAFSYRCPARLRVGPDIISIYFIYIQPLSEIISRHNI